MEAVIGEENNDGLFAKLQTVEFIHHLAYLRVRIAYARIISVAQFHLFFARERTLFSDAAVTAQFRPVMERDLGRVLRRSLTAWLRNLFAVVQIPILLRRAERQ